MSENISLMEWQHVHVLESSIGRFYSIHRTKYILYKQRSMSIIFNLTFMVKIVNISINIYFQLVSYVSLFFSEQCFYIYYDISLSHINLFGLLWTQLLVLHSKLLIMQFYSWLGHKKVDNFTVYVHMAIVDRQIFSILG